MTDKAYIVANEQQEREVLKRLEKEGCSWNDTENTPPTEWHLGRYPYAILVKYGKKLVWSLNVDVSEVEIMSEDKQDKVKISKEVYDALVEWRDDLNLHATSHDYKYYVDGEDINGLPMIVTEWWEKLTNDIEINNRLIAIIRWVNGEDVFEVEKPKKWVVRSKDTDDGGNKHYWKLLNLRGVLEVTSTFELRLATHFDTKEEAESWANSHQEVVEVVDV